MRLFIAINFTDEFKDALSDVMDDMRTQGIYANYVPAENLHLTLAFLGEISPGDIPLIEEAMSQVAMPQIRITLNGIGNFGNLLWAGLEENRELGQYVRNLWRALSEHGIPFDKKAFKPHITLARKVETRKTFDVHVAPVSMTADGVSLMRSDRINNRMRYTELFFLS